MSLLYKNTLLSLLAFSFMACNSIHAYNNDFGLLPNPDIDEALAQEERLLAQPTEVDKPELGDPTWTTELSFDPEAVTAEEYVQEPTTYSYKYDFDTKFYEDAQWRKR